MKFKVISTILFFLTFSISIAQGTNNTATTSVEPAKNISYKIINCINNTYCYDIYMDNKLTIHQSSIPGLPGKEGFKSKLAAENVAQLVINKIKKGEMPPSVTIEEMKKLNAIP
jgi:hypothetical protein